MNFKKDFVWGVSTSAYQIEGAFNEDGRGKSIWDAYCEIPGNIFSEQNGKIACDHYHRYKEDVALMKKMGIKAYRFSISWPRILPKGTGEINEAGVQFYNNLINELIKNEIEPYVTLYHWDLPLELHYKGGWLNREIADWFYEYAKVVAEKFSDRVKHFITINEPQSIIPGGYVVGDKAPGLKLSRDEVVKASHNLLLAHGKAVMALRKYGAPDIKVGYAPTGSGMYPENPESKADIEAAKKCFFDVTDDLYWSWSVAWFYDPVILGKYPEKALKFLGEYLPETWQKDLKIISQPLDFLGINIYNGKEVRAKDDEYEIVERYNGFPKTAFDWPITPEVMRWSIKFLYERYKLPIYITENGLSCCDVISLDGNVHDSNRIDFTTRYLRELKKATEEGADVCGYFHWSFMDNFEWTAGYRERFGLVYVDFRNQQRIIKDSGYWYKTVIESNGDNL